jgi:hypothetical protein
MLTPDYKSEFKVNTFDITERHKKITIFKTGKPWVFKHFFDDEEIF